jgi:hypothetical protein
MTRILLRVAVAVSTTGFLASTVVHVCSVLGHFIDYGTTIVPILWVGMLALLPPGAIVSHQLTRGYPRKERRRASFRGCPGWMERLVNGVGYYTIAGFFGYNLLHLFGPHREGVDPASVSILRIASLVLVLGYVTLTAIMVSAEGVRKGRPPDTA